MTPSPFVHLCVQLGIEADVIRLYFATQIHLWVRRLLFHFSNKDNLIIRQTKTL